MNFRTLLLAMIASMLFGCLQAQDSSQVRFYVRGGDVFYIRLNDRILPVNNTQLLPAGDHTVEIWSPRYKLYKENLTLQPGDSVSVVAKLKLDPEYRSYLVEKEEHKKKQFTMGTAPAALFCISSLSSLALWVPLKRANEQRVKNEFSLDHAVVEQEAGGAARFKSYRAVMATTVSLQIISAAWFLAMRQKRKQLEKPVYRQQNPFTLEYFDISYNAQFQVPQAHFALTF